MGVFKIYIIFLFGIISQSIPVSKAQYLVLNKVYTTRMIKFSLPIVVSVVVYDNRESLEVLTHLTLVKAHNDSLYFSNNVQTGAINPPIAFKQVRSLYIPQTNKYLAKILAVTGVITAATFISAAFVVSSYRVDPMFLIIGGICGIGSGVLWLTTKMNYRTDKWEILNDRK